MKRGKEGQRPFKCSRKNMMVECGDLTLEEVYGLGHLEIRKYSENTSKIKLWLPK